MKAMTWEQIDKDWSGLQKRHRMEIAQAVARYCVGHKMEEVAERLGRTMQWLREHLSYAGMATAMSGVNNIDPSKLEGGFGAESLQNQARKVLSKFAPDVQVKLTGQAGDQEIAEVVGNDAEDFQPYLDHYVREGHEPAAATRLAKAEWAAESAVDAGVIQETTNKKNERVNKILFPDDDVDTFALDLKSHMAKVRAAARFLDQANIARLRTKAVCAEVKQSNAMWVEQVDRIRNFHPTFDEE